MKRGRLIKVISLIAVILASAVYFLLVPKERTKILAVENNDLNNLKDGVYKGASFKFPGKMEVDVTIKDGKLSDIKLIEHKAMKKYTEAIKPLIERIIKKGSTQVDGVTGATISSNALKKAVEEALAKAKEE